MRFSYRFVSAFVVSLLICSCEKELELPPDTVQAKIPFPNHTSYIGSHIKPGNYNQAELDNQTSSFYAAWKREYIKGDCADGELYVYSGDGANTVSEAQGYGMMIMCFMAGYEKSAKGYFDGLFHYYKSHPSYIDNHLMDWQQLSCDDTPGSDDDAASDGDIDIAFSLLLAHNQWGSEGDIDYLEEAKTIINAIMLDEINHATWSVKLGDWCNSGDPVYFYGTRTSDFIISHFRVFQIASGNADWAKVVDECFSLISNIQNTCSSSTGLMPDFIVNTNSTPAPAGANYLEDVYDGDYYYNACRFPWRIGTDYLLSGDSRAQTALSKINTWLKTKVSQKVLSVSNGYKLNGTPIYDWNDATFIGPFTVGAMTDQGSQIWLNALYEELVTNNDLKDGDYYSNTLKLLSMITISGNYWNPEI